MLPYDRSFPITTKPLGLGPGNSSNMADPPFMTQDDFSQKALDIVNEKYGDKFDFDLDRDNFCIRFRNKANPDNVGKMYLQNRFQCMQTYGKDINMDKVKEIINDSTDGLTFYSEPAKEVDKKDLSKLFPMVKTPQWFTSYQETMTSHGCTETIFQVPVDDSKVVSMTMALNYGKFRRYVTEEEVDEWSKNFKVDPVKEAKKNLKSRFSAEGDLKKEWENPAASGVVWRAQLPDELSASLIVLPENINKFKVKGDPVAIFPVASVLYVTGSKDEEGLRVIVDLALEYLNYPHFLTLQPLRLSPKMELSGKSWIWSSFESTIIMDKLRTRNYEANLSAEKAAPSQRRPLSIGSSGGVPVGVSVQDLLQEDEDKPSKYESENQNLIGDAKAIETLVSTEMEQFTLPEENGYESWVVTEKPPQHQIGTEVKSKSKSPPPPPPPTMPPPALTPPAEHTNTQPAPQPALHPASQILSMPIHQTAPLAAPKAESFAAQEAVSHVASQSICEVDSSKSLFTQVSSICDGEILPKDIEAELVEAAMEDPETPQDDFEEDTFFSNVDKEEIVLAGFLQEEKPMDASQMSSFEVMAAPGIETCSLSINKKKTESENEGIAMNGLKMDTGEIVAKSEVSCTKSVIQKTRLEEIKSGLMGVGSTSMTPISEISSSSMAEDMEGVGTHSSQNTQEQIPEIDIEPVKHDIAEVGSLPKGDSYDTVLDSAVLALSAPLENKAPTVGSIKLDTEEPKPVTEILSISAVKNETIDEMFQQNKEENKGKRKKTNSKCYETDEPKLNEKNKENNTDKQLAKIEARGKEKRERQKSLCDDEKGNEQKKEKKKERQKNLCDDERRGDQKIESQKDHMIMNKEYANDSPTPNDDTPSTDLLSIDKTSSICSDKNNGIQHAKTNELGLSHENIWFDAQKYENAYIEFILNSSLDVPSNTKPVALVQEELVSEKDIINPFYVKGGLNEANENDAKKSNDFNDAKHEIQVSKTNFTNIGLSQENIWFDQVKYEDALILLQLSLMNAGGPKNQKEDQVPTAKTENIGTPHIKKDLEGFSKPHVVTKSGHDNDSNCEVLAVTETFIERDEESSQTLSKCIKVSTKSATDENQNKDVISPLSLKEVAIDTSENTERILFAKLENKNLEICAKSIVEDALSKANEDILHAKHKMTIEPKKEGIEINQKACTPKRSLTGIEETVKREDNYTEPTLIEENKTDFQAMEEEEEESAADVVKIESGMKDVFLTSENLPPPHKEEKETFSFAQIAKGSRLRKRSESLCSIDADVVSSVPNSIVSLQEERSLCNEDQNLTCTESTLTELPATTKTFENSEELVVSLGKVEELECIATGQEEAFNLSKEKETNTTEEPGADIEPIITNEIKVVESVMKRDQVVQMATSKGPAPDVKTEQECALVQQVKQHILNRSLPLPQLLPLTPEEKENIKKHDKVQTCSNISHQLRDEFVRATDHAVTIKSRLDESNESAENLLSQLKSRKSIAMESPATTEAPVDVSKEEKNVEALIQEEISSESAAIKPSKTFKMAKGRERKKSEKKSSESERIENDQKQTAQEEKKKKKSKGQKIGRESNICNKDKVQDAQKGPGEIKASDVDAKQNDVQSVDFFSAAQMGKDPVEAEQIVLTEDRVCEEQLCIIPSPKSKISLNSVNEAVDVVQDAQKKTVTSNSTTDNINDDKVSEEERFIQTPEEKVLIDSLAEVIGITPDTQMKNTTDEKAEQNDVDASDFFTAVSIGSEAEEAEKSTFIEVNVSMEGPISIQTPNSVPKASIVDQNDVDAFDFFSPVPIGSAAVEAEKHATKMEFQSEVILDEKQDVDITVEKSNASNRKTTKENDQEKTDSADSQFELYKNVPSTIEPQLVMENVDDDLLILSEHLASQPISKDFKKKSFSKSEGELLDDFQGVSRPPSLLEFEENDKLTAKTKKTTMMKSSASILQTFHETEEQSLNEEKEKSLVSKKKQYKGPRRHTGELSMVRSKLTMIDLEETYDGYDDEEDEEDNGNEQVVKQEEKQKAAGDVVKIESGMKEVFLIADHLPPVPDEEKEKFSFAQIAKGSRLRKRSESLCSIDADISSTMQTSIVSLQEQECVEDEISTPSKQLSAELPVSDSFALTEQGMEFAAQVSVDWPSTNCFALTEDEKLGFAAPVSTELPAIKSFALTEDEKLAFAEPLSTEVPATGCFALTEDEKLGFEAPVLDGKNDCKDDTEDANVKNAYVDHWAEVKAIEHPYTQFTEQELPEAVEKNAEAESPYSIDADIASLLLTSIVSTQDQKLQCVGQVEPSFNGLPANNCFALTEDEKLGFAAPVLEEADINKSPYKGHQDEFEGIEQSCTLFEEQKSSETDKMVVKTFGAEAEAHLLGTLMENQHPEQVISEKITTEDDATTIACNTATTEEMVLSVPLLIDGKQMDTENEKMTEDEKDASVKEVEAELPNQQVNQIPETENLGIQITLDPIHILSRPPLTPSQPELTPEEVANIKKHKKVNAVKNVSEQLQGEFVRATENALSIKSKVEESNVSAQNLLSQVRSKMELAKNQTEDDKATTIISKAVATEETISSEWVSNAAKEVDGQDINLVADASITHESMSEVTDNQNIIHTDDSQENLCIKMRPAPKPKMIHLNQASSQANKQCCLPNKSCCVVNKQCCSPSGTSAPNLQSQKKSKKQDSKIAETKKQPDEKKQKKKKPEDVIPKDHKSPSPEKAMNQIVDPWGDGPIVLDKKHLQLLGLSGLAWDAMQKSKAGKSQEGTFLHLDTTFICFNCGMDAVAMKAKLMKCKRCMIASYCGQECQKSNWLKHKKICKIVGFRRQKGVLEPLKISL